MDKEEGPRPSLETQRPKVIHEIVVQQLKTAATAILRGHVENA